MGPYNRLEEYRAKGAIDEGKRTTNRWFAHSPEAPGATPGAASAATGRVMTLWTFCQSVLLTFNAFAILNEQRFLEKCGLGQSSLTSGYVSATSPRGQLIGLITATQYMRGASSRRSGRSRRRSRARPPRNGCPRFLGTGRPAGRRKERIVSRFLLSVARPRSASSFVAASLTDPRAPPERSPAGRAERAGDLREDGVRLNHEVDIIRS